MTTFLLWCLYTSLVHGPSLESLLSHLCKGVGGGVLIAEEEATCLEAGSQPEAFGAERGKGKLLQLVHLFFWALLYDDVPISLMLTV
jgi:hypothetical protein